jgi:hypothetical protein
MAMDGVDVGVWLDIGFLHEPVSPETEVPATTIACAKEQNTEPAVIDTNPEQEHQSAPSYISIDDFPEHCADCGTHIEQEDREFFYVPLANNPDQAECYCSLCRDQDGAPLLQVTLEPEPQEDCPPRQLSQQEITERRKPLFPGGCEAHIDPPDYTLADRVKEIQAEEQQQSQKKQSFWERIEAQNANFDPKKPVNWFDYGYKKDKQGKWFDPNSRKQGA